MKKNLFLVFCLFAFASTQAQTLKTPVPSPTQTIKQDWGLGTVEISYSRPGVKNRAIFGSLVPYDKVWRTGANSATTLTFSDDVSIGGKKIPAGKYGLLTIPSASEWTMIITKQLDVTSPAAYKEENDVVRVKAKPYALSTAVERFDLKFLESTDSTGKFQLAWDKTGIDLPVSTDLDAKVMKQIESTMKADARPYFASAVYYADNGKDLNQAMVWFDKAIEQNPKAFYMYYQKAKALAKQGKKTEAMAASVKSVQLAKDAKNDDYVALNMELQKTLK